MRATTLYTVHHSPLGPLSILARPRGGDWLQDEIKALREAGVDMLISLLTPDEVRHFELAEEGVCCERQGIRFEAFPIQDRQTPALAASTFHFLQRLDAALVEGQHVAIHCRQGLGRAPLLAACLLLQRGLTLDHAWKLLSEARGTFVPETEAQRAWVAASVSWSRRFRAQDNLEAP